MVNDPQLTELIRAEVQRAVAEATELLLKKLDEQDEWANGLLLALEDLMQALAKARSPVLETVIQDWQKAADHYELARQGLYPDESAQRLEPRKLLYRMLRATGALRHLEE